MAQKDEAGRFTWVEFDPRFHSHLFKCAFSLLGKLIIPSAQKIYKKAIYLFILELFNLENNNKFFILQINAEENHTSWECKQYTSKQLPTTFEKTLLVNARECHCEVCGRLFQSRKKLSRDTCVSNGAADAKTGQKVITPTPKDNDPVASPANVTLEVHPSPIPSRSPTPPRSPTPTPDEPVPENEHDIPTLVEQCVLYWMEEYPGETLMCEGTRTRPCESPATYIKMYGHSTQIRYPKCDFHWSFNCEAIPKRFL